MGVLGFIKYIIFNLKNEVGISRQRGRKKLYGTGKRGRNTLLIALCNKYGSQFILLIFKLDIIFWELYI